MIEELRAIFSKFAEKYNLLWNFEYLETTGSWVLTFLDQERSWGYRRLLEAWYLNQFENATECGEHVLKKVLLKMRFYKIIRENDMEVV